MSRRTHYIAAAIVLLLVLVVLNLPRNTTAQLKLVCGGVFLPLLGLAKSSENLTEKAADTILPKKALLNELAQLRLENQRLQLQFLQSTQLWQENDQLRQALNWQKQKPWKLRAAKVILRDPANWWRTLQIDLGSRDGVSNNLPVIARGGLVGKISETTQTSSKVVLIGDPHCRVAAVVQETMDNGDIVAGSDNIVDPNFVDLTYLDRRATMKPGHNVFTSGLGGIFPKGIPIGQVIDTNSVDYGLYLEARIKLSANLKNLEEVWVVFP